jgi:hypothetical protein
MKQYEHQAEAPSELHEGVPNPELLQKAQAQNPDPSRYVPSASRLIQRHIGNAAATIPSPPPHDLLTEMCLCLVHTTQA